MSDPETRTSSQNPTSSTSSDKVNFNLYNKLNTLSEKIYETLKQKFRSLCKNIDKNGLNNLEIFKENIENINGLLKDLQDFQDEETSKNDVQKYIEEITKKQKNIESRIKFLEDMSNEKNSQLYQLRNTVDDISNLPGVQLTQTKKTNQGKRDQGK